jgi:hypothetical protein
MFGEIRLAFVNLQMFFGRLATRSLEGKQMNTYLRNGPSRSGDTCNYVCSNLSRLIDKDLTSAEATGIAAHLHGCLACRQEFDAMRGQQAILSALASPPGGKVAQERVLRRLESDVLTKQAAAFALRKRGSLRIRVYAPVIAGLTVAVFIVIGADYQRPKTTAGIAHVRMRTVANISLTSAAPRLPENDELTQLFAFHDRLKGEALVVQAHPALATRAIGMGRERRRSKSPRATGAPRFAAIARPSNGLELVAEQGGKASVNSELLASDDVPEAL